jgi:hypothetical protein
MTRIPFAIDGANPLGYLTGLGVAQVLAERREGRSEVCLSWDTARRPVLLAPKVGDAESLINLLTDLTRRPAAAETAIADEKVKRVQFEGDRRKERKKREEIKKRKLPRNERIAALDAEYAPLAKIAEASRAEWRDARAKAAPDVTVSLDLDLNAKSEEFAEHCADALEVAKTSRRWIDFCSSFGVESAGERMAPTPFALISGSGHQHFLGTAGDLMVGCTANHFRSALFGTWLAADEGSSFRWDPADDRRYALLADDPTASGNKPKTIWGANRLAFEALRLFPCIRAKGQRATVGWRTIDEEEVWRWPLWSCDLAPQVFSSILASGDLWRDEPDARARLRTRGVFAVYQSRRLTVGRAPNQKLNLTPAVPVWTSALG